VQIISQTLDYNGFATKAKRLGLDTLAAEAVSTITAFQLLIKEQRHANGTRGIRQSIDKGFTQLGGWKRISSGGIDWTKQSQQGATLGVEVQVSGRTDMLAVDIMHLHYASSGKAGGRRDRRGSDHRPRRYSFQVPDRQNP
jgi:hypothetical protein